MGGIYRNWYAYQYTGGGGGGSSLLTSLISYWKLDEASTGVAPVTRIDSVTATGNDLTDNNTTASGVGIIGNAASIVATNSEFLSRISNSSLQIDARSFTITAWVNCDSTATFRMIITKDLSAPREFQLYFNPGGVINFDVADSVSGNSAAATGAAVTTGVWHLIIGWYDTSDKKARVQVDNGAIVAGAALANGPAVGTNAFLIGARSDGIYFSGLIDEVGRWDRVLTAGEKTSLYNGGAGLSYPF